MTTEKHLTLGKLILQVARGERIGVTPEEIAQCQRDIAERARPAIEELRARQRRALGLIT